MPDFAPRLTFHAAAADMIRWRAEQPENCRPPAVDAIMDRLVGGSRSASELFAASAPRPRGAGADS